MREKKPWFWGCWKCLGHGINNDLVHTNHALVQQVLAIAGGGGTVGEINRQDSFFLWILPEFGGIQILVDYEMLCRTVSKASVIGSNWLMVPEAWEITSSYGSDYYLVKVIDWVNTRENFESV